MIIKEWQVWFNDVKKNTRLIEQYIALYSSELNIENKKAAIESKTNDTLTLKSFRSVWQKVLLLKFFIEHLCHIDQSLYIRCITLWNFFDKDLDLKEMKYFARLLEFIKFISIVMDKKCLVTCKGK